MGEKQFVGLKCHFSLQKSFLAKAVFLALPVIFLPKTSFFGQKTILAQKVLFWHKTAFWPKNLISTQRHIFWPKTTHMRTRAELAPSLVRCMSFLKISQVHGTAFRHGFTYFHFYFRTLKFFGINWKIFGETVLFLQSAFATFSDASRAAATILETLTYAPMILHFCCRFVANLESIGRFSAKSFFWWNLLLLPFPMLLALLQLLLKNCHMAQLSYLFIALVLKKLKLI